MELKKHWTVDASLAAFIWSCNGCNQPVFSLGRGNASDNALMAQVWPLRASTFEGLDGIPDKLHEDVQEAHLCFAVDAHRAAVAMARRALQLSAVDKGAPDSRLVDQIDWLAEQRLITDDLRDLAHEVRLGGNLGAHPDRDGLRTVSKEDAEAVLGFLESFLTYVYRVPAKVARVRAERAGGLERPPHSGD